MPKTSKPSKTRTQGIRAWRPTPEDDKVLASLMRKLGVDQSQIVRIALRKLAEHEGIRAA